MNNPFQQQLEKLNVLTEEVVEEMNDARLSLPNVDRELHHEWYTKAVSHVGRGKILFYTFRTTERTGGDVGITINIESVFSDDVDEFLSKHTLVRMNGMVPLFEPTVDN